MNDSVGDEFSSLAQFDPFDPTVSTVGTDRSGRNHDLSASNTSDGHELPLAAVPIEFLNRGISQLTHRLAPLQDMDHGGRA